MPTIEFPESSVSTNHAVAPEASVQQRLVAIAADVDRMQASLGLAAELDFATRSRLKGVVRRTSLAELEALAALATKYRGVVAGVPVDPKGVRRALEFAAACEPLAAACERLGQKLRDAALIDVEAQALKAQVILAAASRLDRHGDEAAKEIAGALRAARPRRTRRVRDEQVAQPAAPVAPPVK